MKTKSLIMTVGLSALAFAGCESTANTNTNVRNVNSNTAVVVNNNTNMATPMNNNRTSSANVNRADYDKNRADYDKDRRTGDSVGQGLSDGWILLKTRAALATTSDIRESTINVDVSNDVITLKGTVATAAEKAKAETVAKGIEGQKGVKNELQVKPNDSMSNQMVNGSSNMKSNANMNKK